MVEQLRVPLVWGKVKTGLANALFNIGAIKFGAFRLKLHEKTLDAPLSPIYVDLRILRSHPSVMRRTVQILEEMSHGLQFDCYADVPTAATPIVAILSHVTRTPMITPREAKTHGAVGTIDGTFQPGQTVLLVDDLVTKADSKLKAIRTLEANGLKVHDVLVLVDREQGGAEQLGEAGYKLHAAFAISNLLRWYVGRKKIDRAKYEEVMSYLIANR